MARNEDFDSKDNQRVIRCSNCRTPLFGVWKISDKKNTQYFQACCWKCKDKSFVVKEDFDCRIFHVAETAMVSADTTEYNGSTLTTFETVANKNY